MEHAIQIVLVIVLIMAHAPFLGLFLHRVSMGTLPGCLLFGCIGVILYYDFGFILQVFGWRYVSQFFPKLSDVPIETQATLCVILIVTPYLLAIGGVLTKAKASIDTASSRIEISNKLKPVIFIILASISIALAVIGLSIVQGSASIVYVKQEWMTILGRAYIVFLVPLFLLAFFIRTKCATSKSGIAVSILLALASMSATLFLGQRTMTLLPVLILLLFVGKVSLVRICSGVLALFLIASVTIYFYKGIAVQRDASVAERIATVVNNDVIRTNVLVRAIVDSEPIGTRVLPSAGQGYLYSLLLYIPRSVLPEKGYSTAAYFTALANGEDTEYLTWGLGVGFLEEITLNYGLFAILPGIILYGALLGVLDRISKLWPSTVVGCSLAPIWMSGYGSSSIILYFGSMVLFAIVLEEFFSPAIPIKRVERPHFVFSVGR